MLLENRNIFNVTENKELCYIVEVLQRCLHLKQLPEAHCHHYQFLHIVGQAAMNSSWDFLLLQKFGIAASYQFCPWKWDEVRAVRYGDKWVMFYFLYQGHRKRQFRVFLPQGQAMLAGPCGQQLCFRSSYRFLKSATWAWGTAASGELVPLQCLFKFQNMLLNLKSVWRAPGATTPHVLSRSCPCNKF